MIDTINVKNLRSSDDFSNLNSIINNKRNGGKIYFIPAAGNWGDGLINYGSRQFFDVNDLEYEEVNRNDAIQIISSDSNYKGRVVVVGGESVPGQKIFHPLIN